MSKRKKKASEPLADGEGMLERVEPGVRGRIQQCVDALPLAEQRKKLEELNRILQEDAEQQLHGYDPRELLKHTIGRLDEVAPFIPLFNYWKEYPEELQAVMEAAASACPVGVVSQEAFRETAARMKAAIECTKETKKTK